MHKKSDQLGLLFRRPEYYNERESKLFADLAQRQSNGIVNRRFRVQVPGSAPRLIFFVRRVNL